MLGAHAVHVAMAGYTGIVVGKVDERCWAATHGLHGHMGAACCEAQGPTWKLLRVVNGCGSMMVSCPIAFHNNGYSML